MYRNSKSVSVLFFVATLLGMLLPSLASALGTPDGLPPPMEHICDAEKGAAYGLCNAYCQAMDCDSATPSASENACQKVADKFMQLADRPVPCSEACPMYLNVNFPLFNELVSTPGSIVGCEYGSTELMWNQDPRSLKVVEATGDETAVFYTPVGGDISYGADTSSNKVTPMLELDEFESCKRLLEDAIRLSGVTCAGQ